MSLHAVTELACSYISLHAGPWMFQNVPECSKMFQNACRSMSLHAGPWACMRSHKLAYSYKSLHAATWACMQLHELACSYRSLYAFTWACMQLHKLACSSMTLHAVTWACMQFLSLSEQLTRISQCLLCLGSLSILCLHTLSEHFEIHSKFQIMESWMITDVFKSEQARFDVSFKLSKQVKIVQNDSVPITALSRNTK